ncbi:glycosyltransferase family 90 protein [Collybiopsis luxurians FD-317 M1]|nr:glycosyltransferase family 90 protein [Collybiopsis luxurians FD-317 M1]
MVIGDASRSPASEAERILEPVQEVTFTEHRYNPNGLLEVNPEGQHPIFELMEKSEANWQKKLQKASRSLHEAVVEYERRYRRKPPVGFDIWWRYVEENNVQLPDEYDQINRDFEAYWGIDPHDLQAEQLNHELWTKCDTYTIGKLNVDDPITILNSSLKTQAHFDVTRGGKSIVEMLRDADLERYIPPFRANLNPLDNPEMNIEWSLWNEALLAAKKGETISMLNRPQPSRHNGWLDICDPMSPVWSTPLEFYDPSPFNRSCTDPMSPSSSRTFIHDHRASMDPCQHPHLLRQHGQFVNHFQGPPPKTTVSPFFSLSPSTMHRDITVAMPMCWMIDIEPDTNPNWENKSDERLHWRGGNTGSFHSDERDPKLLWRLSHRIRMVDWAQNNLYSNLRILGLGAKKGEPVGQGTVVDKGRWAPAMLDIAFAGKPTACHELTCSKMATMFQYKNYVDTVEAGEFKYVLDMDGNAWSSRFKRLITTSSCIFKATVYPEWFTDRIQPWVQYVPVQIDLSDLWDSFTFFRGDLNGNLGHDDLAKKIGAQGREWSLEFWRYKDLVAYNFRLLLEYARVMSIERDSMSFDYDSWVAS